MLKPFERDGFLRLHVVPDYTQHNTHLYRVLFSDNDTRYRIMVRLKDKGMLAIFYYIPSHSSPMGMKIGCNHDDLHITESISERLLRLPLYIGMTEEELNYTISNVKEEIEKRNEEVTLCKKII